MATEPYKLPKRRANTWPVLMECLTGTYQGAVDLPSWRVTRCTASKDGSYLLRVFPVGATKVEPFQPTGARA